MGHLLNLILCVVNVHICQQFASDFLHMRLINWSAMTKFQNLSSCPNDWFSMYCTLYAIPRLHSATTTAKPWHCCSVSSFRPEIWFAVCFISEKAEQLNPECLFTSNLSHTEKLRSYQILPAVLEGQLPHLCGEIQEELLHLTQWLSRCTDQLGGNITLHIRGLPMCLCQL